jgi:type IV secretion system protein VirB11
MRLAVLSRRNILVSGPTGSGKTTFTKALIREIPGDERLITIEDAKELVLDRHPNHVRLFYSKDDQGLARVTDRCRSTIPNSNI